MSTAISVQGGGIECLIDGVEVEDDISFESIIGEKSAGANNSFHLIEYKNTFCRVGGSSTTTYFTKCINGIWVDAFVSGNSATPYTMAGGGAALNYHGNVHILGGGNESYQKSHYVYNGCIWSNESTIPINFPGGCATVYDDCIHIFQGSLHYKYNGSRWIGMDDMPFNAGSTSSATVYDNKIHVLGNGYNHYAWDGSSWTSVSKLPNNHTYSAIGYKGYLYIFSSDARDGVSKWDGSTWVTDTRFPKVSYNRYSVAIVLGAMYIDNTTNGVIVFTDDDEADDAWLYEGDMFDNQYNGSAVVYNDRIRILGGGGSTMQTSDYSWDGLSWTSVSTLPYKFVRGRAETYENAIHILGTTNDSTYTYAHYKWNGTSWVSASTVPIIVKGSVVYDGKIHVVGGSTDHYAWDGSSWTSVSTLPRALGSEITPMLVYDDKLHIIINGYNHYSWDGTSWTSVSTLLYNTTRCAAGVIGDKIHVIGGQNSPAWACHVSWDGEKWNSESSGYILSQQSLYVVHDDRLHIIGSSQSSYQAKHWSYGKGPFICPTVVYQRVVK